MIKKDSFFTIRQVIDLTGVSEFSIRGWESRYQAINPSRTASGRRLYTTDDLLKIKALKDLVDQGHPISSIAQLSLDELQEILSQAPLISNDAPHPQVLNLLQAAQHFYWDKVKKVFQAQRKKNEAKDFIFHFLLPLIKEINHLVSLNQLSIAGEHILSAMIKEELYLLKNAYPAKKTKVRLVFATAENELHELGILLSSTLASIAGKAGLYIGVNTPQQQIADVCLRYQATHLVLSCNNISNEGQKKFLMVIHFLDKQLPKSITFCLGGPVLNSLRIKMNRDYKLFTSIQDINQYFESLKN